MDGAIGAAVDRETVSAVEREGPRKEGPAAGAGPQPQVERFRILGNQVRNAAPDEVQARGLRQEFNGRPVCCQDHGVPTHQKHRLRQQVGEA